MPKLYNARKYSKARRPIAKRIPRQLNNAIDKAVNRHQEIKQFQYGYDNIDMVPYLTTSGTFQTNNVIPLIPNHDNPMLQGDSNSDRIGNKIKIKSVHLKLIIMPLNYNSTTNPTPRPHDVRMIICHSKATPTAPIVSSTFFDSNNATVSPQDDLSDMLLDVNKDIYVVSSDKKFKVGYTTMAGTGANPGNQYFANNDYKYNKFIQMDITKYCPASVVWNDDSSTPVSFLPVAILMGANANGVTSTDGESSLKYWAQVTIRYYD